MLAQIDHDSGSEFVCEFVRDFVREFFREKIFHGIWRRKGVREFLCEFFFHGFREFLFHGMLRRGGVREFFCGFYFTVSVDLFFRREKRGIWTPADFGGNFFVNLLSTVFRRKKLQKRFTAKFTDAKRRRQKLFSRRGFFVHHVGPRGRGVWVRAWVGRAGGYGGTRASSFLSPPLRQLSRPSQLPASQPASQDRVSSLPFHDGTPTAQTHTTHDINIRAAALQINPNCAACDRCALTRGAGGVRKLVCSA